MNPHWLTRIMMMSRYQARIALQDEMSSISERRYAASWLGGVEYTLWEEVLDGRQPELAALAVRAGGWWAWPKIKIGKRFYSAAAWSVLFINRGAAL